MTAMGLSLPSLSTQMPDAAAGLVTPSDSKSTKTTSPAESNQLHGTNLWQPVGNPVRHGQRHSTACDFTNPHDS